MSLTRRRRGGARPGGGDEDRGAVAPTVGVLLASGVLLGFLALVVDVGQIYVERQELRSGADAAALAVGKACALGLPQCLSTGAIVGLAQYYADANSGDGVSAVQRVCGRLPDVLPACPPPLGNLADCIGAPPAVPIPYIEIHLSTELPDGRFALPPAFAQTMWGNSGFEGASVAACARVTWQPPAQLPVLALTVSTCELDDATTGATSFAAAPPYPPDPPLSAEYTMALRSGAHGSCGDPPGPWEAAGPAAQLVGDQSCQLTLPANGVAAGYYLYNAVPTYRPPDSCVDRLRLAAQDREVVYLPVHDAVTGSLVNDFRTVSLAPFVVTGFSFGSDPLATVDLDEPSWLRSPPEPPCSGETQACISGLFVGPPVPVTALADDALVRLIG